MLITLINIPENGLPSFLDAVGRFYASYTNQNGLPSFFR